MAIDLERRLAAALLDPGCLLPDGLVSEPDAARRFAVHRNNVVGSLIDTLADIFPVGQWLVGEAFFRAMAAVFVRAEPPRSRILSDYGGGFAAFVEGFPPAAPVPYLADVARLEFARLRALHAADAAPLDDAARAWGLQAGPSASGLRLVLHPSLHAGIATSAAGSICEAFSNGRDLAMVDVSTAESWVVFRADLSALTMRVTAAAVVFIDALQADAPLARADAAARDRDAAFDVTATLLLLARHGLISGITPP